MGGGIRRFRNHSVAGTVRWPITLALQCKLSINGSVESGNVYMSGRMIPAMAGNSPTSDQIRVLYDNNWEEIW